jgi:hypothetical protein
MNNQSKFIRYTILFLFCIIGLQANAQNGQLKEKIKDKVKAQKVAYITEQLDLTELEAQKFWPVYNSYQSEIEQLRASLDMKSVTGLSDKEAEDLMYAVLDGRSKEIDIQKKYIQKMKSVISAKKIALLYKAERDFKEQIISNIRERRKDRRMGGE